MTRRSASRIGWLLGLPLMLACSPRSDGDQACRPLARLDGEPICERDVTAPVAFRIHRHQLDIYSLLKSEIERLVDARLLEQAAAEAGLTPDQLLEREVETHVEPVTEADVDRYLEANPREAQGGEPARPRIRFYLEERQRIERRLALLARLREAAGYQLLLEPPPPPRTSIDVAGAPARGPTEASLTIVHFAAFGSQHSARSARNLMRLREELPGGFRWVHRNFLSEPNETSLLAAQLGFVAQQAGAFWDYHDRLFAHAGPLDAATVERIAREVGLDPRRIDAAQGDTDLLGRIRADLEAARSAGAVREPTLFVNGRYFSGLFPYDRLRAVAVEELAAAGADPESRPGS